MSDGATEFPARWVRIIVPYPIGGGHNAYARLMRPYLEMELKTPVTVTNRPGNGGLVGANRAYHAQPDGRTLLLWNVFTCAIHAVWDHTDIDPLKMTHVGCVTQTPNSLVLAADAGVDDWDEFTDRLSEFTFATVGRETESHLAPIMLAEMMGVFSHDKLSFVHYDGTNPAIDGFKAGEVDAFMPGTAVSAIEVVKRSDARLFAVFGDERHEIADYLKEKDMAVNIWTANLDDPDMNRFSKVTRFSRILTGPPFVADAIQEKQVAAFDAVLENEKFRKEARAVGFPLFNPQADPEFVSDEISNLIEVLRSDPYRVIMEKP